MRESFDWEWAEQLEIEITNEDGEPDWIYPMEGRFSTVRVIIDFDFTTRECEIEIILVEGDPLTDMVEDDIMNYVSENRWDFM